MDSPDASQATHSGGTLLGGKITYRQPGQGFRTGIEPILLAASVPARAGERVLECGTGAGPGMLALAARVEGFFGTAIERDPAMAALAAANLAENGFINIHLVVTELEVWEADGVYDHAFANPPWHRSNSTPPKNTLRQDAKTASPGLLKRWTARMAASLRRRGTLTLIVPAAAVAEAMHALLAADCGETALLPLWPHADEAAKLILLRGIKQGKGPSRVLPGLVLHTPQGAYTEPAERVLRYGKHLSF